MRKGFGEIVTEPPFSLLLHTALVPEKKSARNIIPAGALSCVIYGTRFAPSSRIYVLPSSPIYVNRYTLRREAVGSPLIEHDQSHKKRRT